MLAILKSFGLTGLAGYQLNVEVDINIGLPSYDIVGLADTAIKESRERVRSAIKNSGLNYPMERITVNLAPADRKKEGAIYDLAIAVGILKASGQLAAKNVDGYLYFGELSLEGKLRQINGLLPLLISAREFGFTDVIIPKANTAEASYIDGLNIYAAADLSELTAFLKGDIILEKLRCEQWHSQMPSVQSGDDFSLVKGQKLARRAVEIAVSGGHNILMLGPPGSGKTMISRCIAGIMPRLTFEEALETTKIHSVAGELDINEGIVSRRPFRSPHHTATVPSLIGGTRQSRPGEISLAHNGVLFLDEVTEYPRNLLETLRQPLEDGTITVSRVSQTIEYPAKFMLVASMNPCPCGNYGSKNAECRCTQSQIMRYLGKLSAPLMDRIDIQVEVDGVSYGDITSEAQEESSQDIKTRVERARDIQIKRFKNDGIFTNSRMRAKHIGKYCALDQPSSGLLEAAFNNLKLTARAYTRILKVARTIADLAGSGEIKTAHIAEAIQYRSLDRKYRSFI